MRMAADTVIRPAKPEDAQALVDRIVDMAPDIVDKVGKFFEKKEVKERLIDDMASFKFRFVDPKVKLI